MKQVFPYNAAIRIRTKAMQPMSDQAELLNELTEDQQVRVRSAKTPEEVLPLPRKRASSSPMTS